MNSLSEDKILLLQNLSFSNADITDLEQIVEIQRLCYIKNYVNDEYQATEEQINNINWSKKLTELKQILAKKQSLALVAKINNEAVGSVFLVNKEESMELKSMFVHPSWQNISIGQNLMNAILKYKIQNKPIFLETTVADKFYLKFGFEYLNSENSHKKGIKMILR